MKYFLLLSMIILASAQTGRSQCAPNNPTGNIGFYPATDLLPCVDKGVYYDETFYIENVDSFYFSGFGTLTVDTLIIDSIVNIPCNLQWISDNGDNTYYRAGTGCIRIFGITEDSVGQYELQIYVTLKTSLLGTLQGEINQIIRDLEALAGNLGIDFEYYIRVKEQANNCPNIDRNNNTPLARTAEKACTVAGELTVEITGDSSFCRGNNSQLSVQLTNVTNPAVEWIPASAVSSPTSATTSIALTQSGYVTVGITDTANTGNTYFDRVWVQVDTANPLAGFTVITNGYNIKLESTSLNGIDYNWTLGDQTTATGTVLLHTYATDGIYPVSLTVGNSCGTSVYYDTLYIGNVGIANRPTTNLQYTLYPNPAHGTVEVKFGGLQPQEPYSITILDLSGKKVVNTIDKQYTDNAPLQIPVEALQPGIYIFQIKTLHSSSFQKLIIY